MSLHERLFRNVSQTAGNDAGKVTVVGAGQVGMACAFSILSKGISNNIALVDMDSNKLKGEMLDLQHGSMFLNNAKIVASTDYAVTIGSNLCIVTAGVRQKEGESRLDLVQRNVHIFKHIIPQLVRYSPDTTILVVSNPVDTLSYVAWKLSGLPVNKVIGSGTNLDSSRFRFLLSECFKIAPSSCHAYVIGEHGDSSVPVWSGVNIGGVNLKDLDSEVGTENDTNGLALLHQKVILSAYEIIKMKGYTSWAIGLSVSSIAHSILNNTGKIHVVSTIAKGLHGIENDVYLSLPCAIGNTGVKSIVKQRLNKRELEMLQKSASLLDDIQKSAHN